ncbi:type II secretion system protein J [Paenibacillus sp. NFR01]|uniref:PulJ/GspJ family protein n=1 Tax=Paenibacillus sp. NFR01 TaxID=1566279 RepID=UPI0008C25C44|nr:prepilin-type N-terminal cleavage/methylation domain-containing protein [Paenibacillus sp. NFR01]SEU14635.1 prepilin-type N-terminal cleavage/methylation domain-containing protein [Paenibacillus sp. NFR01]
MRRFVKRLRGQQGLTLIELIAALSLFSLVSGLIYGVVSFGMQSYQRVTMENTLREESDLLMSAVITEIYTFAPTSVYSEDRMNNGVRETAIYLQKDNGSGGTDKVRIGIADGKLSIADLPASGTSTPAAGTTNPLASPAPSASPAPYDLRTTIDSELGPNSALSLECSVGAVQPCESGLLNVNLSLILTRGDKERRLDMESKFGF